MSAAPAVTINPRVSEFVKSPKLLLIGGKWMPA